MTNNEYLKSVIEKLSAPVDYQWRVQSFSKFKAQATCVPYIDARDCVRLLNEHAIYGWERIYAQIGDSLFCQVGLVMPDRSTQWRSDCGTESQTEKEKGQSSDAFKRACVNFGIGKFLYDLKMEYVDADAIKGDTDSATHKKFPNVIDDNRSKVYDLTEFINNRKKAPKRKKPEATTIPTSGETTKPTVTPKEAYEKASKTGAVPKQNKKDELTPTHKSWNYCVTRVKEGTPLTIIKESFTISTENEDKLIKAASLAVTTQIANP
jgi:hypothetical protein